MAEYQWCYPYEIGNIRRNVTTKFLEKPAVYSCLSRILGYNIWANGVQETKVWYSPTSCYVNMEVLCAAEGKRRFLVLIYGTNK